MSRISLFIPVYNGEEILEKNLAQVYDRLKELKYDFELFIIDDSSTDSSPVIGKKLSDRYREVRFVGYDNGPSRRENLAKSFTLAKGDILAFMDVDLSVDLKHLKELIEAVEKSYDISTGSRYVEGAVVKRSLSRNIISNAFKYFIRLYFSSGINDHQCGFKAFKKEVILKLVDEMGYDSKFKRKFFWDSEMLVRAQRDGYRIKEIPVKWIEKEKSTWSFWKETSILPYIFDLKSRL